MDRLAMARCNTTRTTTSDCGSLCLHLTGQHHLTRNNRKDRAAKGSFQLFFFHWLTSCTNVFSAEFEVRAAWDRGVHGSKFFLWSVSQSPRPQLSSVQIASACKSSKRLRGSAASMGRLLQLEALHRMGSLYVRLMVKLEAGHGDLAETSTSKTVNGQSASQRWASEMNFPSWLLTC